LQAEFWYIHGMKIPIKIIPGVAFLRPLDARRLIRWIEKQCELKPVRLVVCLAVCLSLTLSLPGQVGVIDLYSSSGEPFLVPATYDPIAVLVEITAYNPVMGQTDETPFIMASGKTVYQGAVALSRDLERDLGLKFGDTIEIDGFGQFMFEDRMNRRWKRRVDILLFCPEKARQFGVRKSFLRVP
jgi:3D (Asp-Asp-Asp) domain-containing protein